MSLTPEQMQEAARQAQQIADSARSFAENSQGVADQLALAASAATHGTVDPTVFRLAIFVLSIFVGYYVVWSVTPALHTPLMSVTNAISSVIVVGAMLAVGGSAAADLAAGTDSVAAQWFGFFALIMASVNIFGGFLVTQRMLAMYKKKD